MKDLDRQTDYWNRNGPSKPFAHPVNLAPLADLLTPTSRILDVGCGYGRVLGYLQGYGYRNLIGVDPAAEMITTARERWPQITFEQMIEPPALPVPNGSVDAVLLFTVLTCVPTDDGQRAIVEEIVRVLHPNGLLYISDLWLQTDDRNRERYQAGQAKYGVFGVFDLPEGVTLRHHERRWIDALTCAFELLACDDIDVVTMNGHSAKGFQWLGRKDVRRAVRK